MLEFQPGLSTAFAVLLNLDQSSYIIFIKGNSFHGKGFGIILKAVDSHHQQNY